MITSKMILICELPHIILMQAENIATVKDLSYIFLNIALGVGAFKGLGYLKTYKEKRSAATFTFWIQLKLRIMEIKSWLENDFNLINYLFDENARSLWESDSADLDSRILNFKNIIVEAKKFIENASDQIPAYLGWIDDYNEFIQFLNDVIQFDICIGDDYFKFVGEQSVNVRNMYCKNKCQAMQRMCDGIEVRQKKVEEELTKEEIVEPELIDESAEV